MIEPLKLLNTVYYVGPNLKADWPCLVLTIQGPTLACTSPVPTAVQNFVEQVAIIFATKLPEDNLKTLASQVCRLTVALQSIEVPSMIR